MIGYTVASDDSLWSDIELRISGERHARMGFQTLLSDDLNRLFP